MLDERRIAMLLAVVEHGSFTRAAAALSFTASAVSQQMALLERDAGATLFERSPRGVRLTTAGAALVRHAESMRHQLFDARAEMAAITEAAGGRFAFGSFPTATATIAAPAVYRSPDFQAQQALVANGLGITLLPRLAPPLSATTSWSIL